jgi:hypothetical protein
VQLGWASRLAVLLPEEIASCINSTEGRIKNLGKHKRAASELDNQKSH